MAEKKINLKWRSSTLTALEAIYFYIAESNPENAADFIERMIEFGNSLSIFPDKYGLCRFKKFAQKGYHCAVFEKNYMFVYSFSDSKVSINRILHVSRLK